MEVWQREHIRKNLPELIKRTQCATTFLAILQSAKIISDDDVASLNLLTKTMSEKAKELYQIAQSRIGGYNGLKSALLQTDQSGALHILSEVNQHNFPTQFKSHGTISYDKNSLLGRGCLNTVVYKGRFANRDVAVKIINIEYIEIDKVLQEVDFLVKLDKHDHVVRYFTTEITEDFALIAFELCLSNLHELVTNGGSFQIGAKEILRQSSKGIAFLHSRKIMHRDLKPANILIDHNVEEIEIEDRIRVKISDFGMSRKLPEGGSRMTFHSTGIGTEGWIAPEVLSQVYGDGGGGGSGSLTFKMGLPADIFSLGCIFYFVLTEGKHPFGPAFRQNGNILDGKPQLNENELKLVENVNEKAAFIELIRKMIAHEEKDRPTSASVLSNQLFKNPVQTVQTTQLLESKIANPIAIQTGSSDKQETFAEQIRQNASSYTTAYQRKDILAGEAASASLQKQETGVKDDNYKDDPTPEPKVEKLNELKLSTDEHSTSTSALTPIHLSDYDPATRTFLSNFKEERVPQLTAERLNTQKKVFTRWVNSYLQTINKSVTNLETDLSDGCLLISLIEIIYETKLPQTKEPKLRILKLENVTVALTYLREEQRLNMVNIEASDVVDSNSKLIFGLLWSIIMSYQGKFYSPEEAEEDNSSVGGGDPKHKLLKWIQNQIPSLSITNFTTDWYNGKAVGALVDAVAPGLNPRWNYESGSPKDAFQAADLAMAMARDWLDIKWHITPEEMIDPKIDEGSRMIYLLQFPTAKLKPGAPLNNLTTI